MFDFCPACFSEEKKLGVIESTGEEYYCTSCKMVYPKHTTFVSENAIRVYIKEMDDSALLEELEELVKD